MKLGRRYGWVLAVGLLALPAPAGAAPLILPSHAGARAGKPVQVEVVPPDTARACTARFTSRSRRTRRYRVELGGPSRSIVWTLGRSARGSWLAHISCGLGGRDTGSLGTVFKRIRVGHRGHGRGRIIKRGSFRARRGYIPEGPPVVPAAATARMSAVPTPDWKDCGGSKYMSRARVVGTGYATELSFYPKPSANQAHDQDAIWVDLLNCVGLMPPVPLPAMDSMFKQMVCHSAYANLSNGHAGDTWDFEAWHLDVSWFIALDPGYQCQKWGDVGEPEFDFIGHLVQSDKDTNPQKAAYLVVDGRIRHVLTIKAFSCLKDAGAPGPELLPDGFIQTFMTPPGADIGDEACPPAAGGGGGNGGGGGGGGGTPPSGAVALSQGGPATAGYWYAISLSGFAANAAVTVSCRDSVSPGGFRSFTLTTNGSGQASTSNSCYSGDGPDHWVVAGASESNHVSWTVAQQTWQEQETPNHPVNTFTNYHNASGMGQPIASGQWVAVSCKVYDPFISSVVPDGYWYRIASAPWNNAYYSPANTFMNGDPYGGPYSHNTDFAVPNC